MLARRNEILLRYNYNYEDQIMQIIFACTTGCTFVQEVILPFYHSLCDARFHSFVLIVLHLARDTMQIYTSRGCFRSSALTQMKRSWCSAVIRLTP